MNGTPPTKQSSDDQETEIITIESLFEEARARIESKDFKTAFRICTAILDSGKSQMRDVVEVIIIFETIGQTEAANSVREHLLTTIRANRDRAWDDADSITEMGEYLIRFDAVAEGEGEGEGEEYLRRGRELDPTNFQSVFTYFVLLCKTDRLDLAVEIAKPMLVAHPHKFSAIKPIMTTLDHCNGQAQAQALLNELEPTAETDKDRETIAEIRAGLSNQGDSVDQRQMVTGIFDSFAESYDSRLAKLGNNGPAVIRDLLTQLDLPQDNSRRILDAGCGTGLCAPFLRPLAKTLLGVDLSIPMLERCRERGGHDMLARTDLAALDTWPEGQFDMIICADVLVYFGELKQVFENFSTRSNPGAWLIFTVEELNSESEDHHFYASGRHKHSESYLRRALEQAGFSAPSVVQRDRLRNELGDPVYGIAMASQRVAD